MTIVLAISPAHDSSVCLYEDGNIVSFFKEERLTKVKRDKNPIRSLNRILEKINDTTIDALVWAPPSNLLDPLPYINLVQKYCNFKHFVDLSNDHHLQHASLAFYNSGFDNSAVIVIDRNGSILCDGARESETIFYASYPDNFSTIYKSFWVYDNSVFDKIDLNNPPFEIDISSMHGVVKVYESATSLIRQNVLENGKTMGLSSYGKPSNFPPLFLENSNLPIDAHFVHENFDNENRVSAYKKLMKISSQSIDMDNYQIYADYAFHVQRETEKAVKSLIIKSLEKTNCKNVVISGGFALNVVANHFFIKEFPEINFYFEPIADDTGNSIGAAMLQYRTLSKDNSKHLNKTTFFHGDSPNFNIIENVGKNCNIDDVTDYLINNNPVAIFQGKSEAGPRALGHRSILYYPVLENSKEIVNKIKKREWYRPFAAILLEEDAEEYFEMLNIKSSPFMTVSFFVKEKTKTMFPGVVHVDGTCRIQTVNEDNPTMFNLLTSVKNKTGSSILLNTSFNLAGEPLVESIDDAIKTVINSDLDLLWIPETNKILNTIDCLSIINQK